MFNSVETSSGCSLTVRIVWDCSLWRRATAVVAVYEIAVLYVLIRDTCNLGRCLVLVGSLVTNFLKL